MRTPLPLLIFAAWLASASLTARAEPAGPLSAEELQLYRDLAARIKAHYVDPVDDRQLFKACLAGMVEKLDAHSSFMDAETVKEVLQPSGEFAGIGIEYQSKDGRTFILATIEGGPAAKAGLLPGDEIQRIDGVLAQSLAPVELRRKLQGKPGSSLRIHVLRPGRDEPISVDLKRDIVRTCPVKANWIEPGYAHIRVNAFPADVLHPLARALSTLRATDPGELRGLVLDLRNNGGGTLEAAKFFAGAFLPEGAPILSRHGRGDEQTIESMDVLGPVNRYMLESIPYPLRDTPLVVLVNGQTAGAAEIVAAAFRDHGRARLIGSPTFGKDSLQAIMLVEPVGVRLTTHRWRTPKGASVAPYGLVSDVRVDQVTAPENVLAAAIDLLKEGGK